MSDGGGLISEEVQRKLEQYREAVGAIKVKTKCYGSIANLFIATC